MSEAKILIFTFWIPRGVIAQTLFPLKDKYEIIYASGDRGLISLMNKIRKSKPDYILGLGYYRRSTKYIRAEQKFTNKYGRGEVWVSACTVRFRIE